MNALQPRERETSEDVREQRDEAVQILADLYLCCGLSPEAHVRVEQFLTKVGFVR